MSVPEDNVSVGGLVTDLEHPYVRELAAARKWKLHDDEAMPRDQTFLHERANWQTEVDRLREALADAQELAAMYLQCLNSRALERGETVEQVAAFCRQEFEENPWLKGEYEKLAKREASVKAFCEEAGLT